MYGIAHKSTITLTENLSPVSKQALRDKPFRYFDHAEVKSVATSPFFKAHTNRTEDHDRQAGEATVPSPSGGYLVKSTVGPGLAEQWPAKYPFLGKVFVLIDGGTFSTAADFSAVVQHLKRATFIGEETGGGHFGNNSGAAAKVTLPNSKLVVWLQLVEYWTAVQGDDNNRRGTISNYVIKTTISDLLRGVDRQLDYALKLADTSTASN